MGDNMSVSPKKRTTQCLVFKTTTHQLARVLGKVVEIVVKAEEAEKLEYDGTQLTSLIEELQQCETMGDPVVMTHDELSRVVRRVMTGAQVCVREGVKAPTGIHISNLGRKLGSVKIYWGNVVPSEIKDHSTASHTSALKKREMK